MAVAATLLLAALGWAAPAATAPAAPTAATPARNELDWQAPAGCPNQADVQRGVEVLLGAPLPPVRSEAVRARARVRPAGDGFALTLELDTSSGHGTRRLRAATCQELADVAAVLVAVAIDPDVRLPDPGDDPRLARGQPALVAPPEPTAAEPAASPPPPAEPHVEPPPSAAGPAAPDLHAPAGLLRTGASLLLGPLPGPTLGLALGAGVRARAFRGDLRAAFGIPRTARAGQASVRVWSWALGLRACGVVHVRRLSVPMCAVGEAGGLVGRGLEVDGGRRRLLPAASAGFGAEVRWQATERLALVAGGELLAALIRPGFTVAGAGVVHRAAPALGRLGLALEVQFPARSWR